MSGAAYINIQEVKYDKILNGTVTEKLKIARIFKENLDALENMKKWNNKWKTHPILDHVTCTFIIMSAVIIQNWKYIIIIIIGASGILPV